MRIDLDNRLDKEYPERSTCEVNERDCDFDVDVVCHECGTKMCDACSIGVRHQPLLSKYTYDTPEGTERFQQHCPDCIGVHTLNLRNVAIGISLLFLGIIFAVVGGADTLALTVIGLVMLVGGGFVLRAEYRLKVRDNDNYGIMSLW